MLAISNLTSFAQDVGVWESVLSHFKFQFDLLLAPNPRKACWAVKHRMLRELVFTWKCPWPPKIGPISQSFPASQAAHNNVLMPWKWLQGVHFKFSRLLLITSYAAMQEIGKAIELQLLQWATDN
ncbi:hypothetical protein Peur_069144 [Populus x canadensis]